MTQDISVTQVCVEEVDDLRRLSVETFFDTYAAYNTADDMRMYAEKYFTRETLLQELTSDENHFFFVKKNNEPAGYIKLRTRGETPPALRDKLTIELERIYVLKHLQNSGLGSRLLDFALEFAKSRSYDTLWLGVWQYNGNAISFYKKNGFEIFGDHTFILGRDEQTDRLMKKELKS